MNEVMIEAPLLEETGKVVAIEGAYAVIETQQRSACSSCATGDSCGTSALSGLFSQRRHKVHLLNHLNLRVGDMAVIGINETVLLSTAILAYMLPLLLMISFAVLSSLSGFDDGINFVFSLLGLFTGMQISNRIVGNRDFEVREIVLLRNASETYLIHRNN